MIDRLNKVSQAFVFLGAVLYFFGFITFNSFLSRFGMVSFDVVNSRFVFAGFFSCLSVGVAILLGWMLAKELPLGQLFNISDQPLRTRLFRYVKVPLFIFFANNALFQALVLGKYIDESNGLKLTYSHFFGNYDVVGKYLENVKTGVPGGIDFVGKWTINFFVYAFLLGLLIYLISRLGKKKKSEIESQAPIQSQTLPIETKSVFAVSSEHKLLWIFDATFVFLISVTAFYCTIRLFSEKVDFSSFNENFDLTNNNLFVWLFPNIMSVYFFFQTRTIKMITKGSATEILKIDNLSEVFQTIGYYLIPIIAALITFGQAVFPKIPFAVGGGQPRQVTLETTDKKTFKKGKFFVLGESSQYLFLTVMGDKESSAFQVNKNEIRFLKTAQKSNVK